MAIAKIVKWTVIGLVTACVIVIGGLLIFPEVLTGPTAAPLQLTQLSAATRDASTASSDGTWIVGRGSVAGFRVKESLLTQSGTIVGRTTAVTGSIVVSNNEISSGSFQVDLSKLTMGGKMNKSFLQILNTAKYPDATLTLTNPVVFTSIPTNGQTISSKTTGSLTMRGITHAVTFTLRARYNGSTLEATGSAPILASDWSIKSPFAIHNNDVIEFLVILKRG